MTLAELTRELGHLADDIDLDPENHVAGALRHNAAEICKQARVMYLRCVISQDTGQSETAAAKGPHTVSGRRLHYFLTKALNVLSEVQNGHRPDGVTATLRGIAKGIGSLAVTGSQKPDKGLVWRTHHYADPAIGLLLVLKFDVGLLKLHVAYRMVQVAKRNAAHGSSAWDKQLQEIQQYIAGFRTRIRELEAVARVKKLRQGMRPGFCSLILELDARVEKIDRDRAVRDSYSTEYGLHTPVEVHGRGKLAETYLELSGLSRDVAEVASRFKAGEVGFADVSREFYTLHKAYCGQGDMPDANDLPGFAGALRNCLNELRAELRGALPDKSMQTHSFSPAISKHVKPRAAKMSKAEANVKTRAFLREHPEATAREVSSDVGCALGMVSKLPAWQAIQEARKKGRKPKAPRAVALTEKVIAVIGRDDTELERLINDQKRDKRGERKIVHRKA